MKFTITEEDLDKAIQAGTEDICSSCIFSQTILRTLNKESVITCVAENRFAQFTFNRIYSEDFKIENKGLVEIIDKFDVAAFSHRNFDSIRQLLPFEFEYNFVGEL